MHVPVCRPDLSHIEKLNDQVGYITTARWLADTGELRSQLIYPGSFGERWRIYMPGHYWALAASYLVLGDRPIAWLLPNLLGFATATVCLFLTGRRLYGACTGALAAALFAVFPANIFFSFTSMSEQNAHRRVDALVLRLCSCEAAAALDAALAGSGPSSSRRRVRSCSFRCSRSPPPARPSHARSPASAIASVAMLALVFAWQAADGRQGLPISWLLADFNYLDAMIEEPALNAELLGDLATKFAFNVEMLSSRLLHHFTDKWEPALSATQILFLVLTFACGYRRAPADLYPLGAGVLGMSVLFIVMVLHSPREHIFYRHMLFVVPFIALATAPCLLEISRFMAAAAGPHARRLVPVAVLAAVAILATSHGIVRSDGGLHRTARTTCEDVAPRGDRPRRPNSAGRNSVAARLRTEALSGSLVFRPCKRRDASSARRPLPRSARWCYHGGKCSTLRFWQRSACIRREGSTIPTSCSSGCGHRIGVRCFDRRGPFLQPKMIKILKSFDKVTAFLV